jgi:LysM repeat protein
LKRTSLVSALLALIPAIAAMVLLLNIEPRTAEANSDPFRCTNASLYFPGNGIIGWTYGDPASTDRDAHGHRTAHTGIDVFIEGGNGAPVHAPADGIVSRQPGAENLNLILPNVTNRLTGEMGIEVYISHVHTSLGAGQEFRAGDVIAMQKGDHVHMSIGAFMGYDDRQISQTQDPSAYFHAALSYSAYDGERQKASFWCLDPVAAATTTTTSTSATLAFSAAPVADFVHVVQSGDTLSGIAALYGSTVEAIATANGLSDVDFLSLDQELVIPGLSGGPAHIHASDEEPASAGAAPAGSTGGEYVVEDGDTLYGIAEKLGVDGEALIELNGLTDPDTLSIGDVLLVP